MSADEDNAADAVTEATNQLSVSDKDVVNGEKHGADSDKSSNEERKIFVGGISSETTNEDLLAFFSQFGAVSQAQVKYDRVTGRSRGFAFVEFADAEPCRLALKSRDQTIKGKAIEVKPAKSRENKKVFVGGLPADFSEEKLRAHFEQYGKVEDIEWPFDRQRNVRRNFAFVVFETEEGADSASVEAKQTFGERECDVKKATPQSRRGAAQGAFGFGMSGYGTGRGAAGAFYTGGRGGRGAMGGFGAYGGGGAYQAGFGGWGGAGTGNWGDWYGQQAATNYGGYYGGGYGGAAAGAGANNTDYWTSQQPGGNTWNYGGAGATGASAAPYDSYNSAQTAGGGGGRAAGGRTGAYQSYQQH